ncbi:MAG: rhomboid family intramembrane serine protease [Candidatus Ozemobacteraceae bacterium]
MIFSLAKRDFRTYRGYLLQLFTLLAYMILMVGWGENGSLAIAVSLGFLVILVIIPVVLQKRIETLLADQRFEELENPAWWKANIAWSELNLHMLHLARASGRISINPGAAETALRELFGKGEPFDGMTRLFLAMIHFHQRRFESLLADLLIPGKPNEAYSFEELLYIVRGLLETGQYEEAMPAQLELEKKALIEANGVMVANLQIARLLFFAFMGWRPEYEALIDSKMPIILQLPSALREFWGGVAAFNSGDFLTGRTRMEKALAEQSPELPPHWLEWMRRRLTDLTTRQEEFACTTLPRLAGLRTMHLPSYQHHVTQTATAAAPQPIAQTGTQLLLGLIAIAFVISNGFANTNDLIDLLAIGANSGFLVNQGEWFRIVSAMFLHLGWLHLVMNLVALRFFGPPIETVVGLPMFLAIYLFSGLCGGVATVWGQPGISVGASGAVLGLLSAAIVLELLERNPDGPLAKSGQFTTLVFIMLINLAIGTVEKGIDNSAHMGGLVGGAVAGLIAWIFLRNRVLRNSGNILSVVFLLAIVVSTTWGITRPRTPLPYPVDAEAFTRVKAGPLPITLELPKGWTIEKSKEDPSGVIAEGPLGEHIEFTMGRFGETPEDLIKIYAQERTKAIMGNSGLVFKALSDPASSSLGLFTCWKMQWRLEAAERPIVQRDHFCILEKEKEYILVQCMLPTNRDQVYDPLLQRILSSMIYKGEVSNGIH